RIVDLAGRATYHRLLDGGVRIVEWTASMLHAKAVVVDGRWCSIGSYNFDHRSLLHNLEVTAFIFDQEGGGALEADLRNDLAVGRAIDRDRFARRPLVEKVLQRIAYWFRSWL